MQDFFNWLAAKFAAIPDALMAFWTWAVSFVEVAWYTFLHVIIDFITALLIDLATAAGLTVAVAAAWSVLQSIPNIGALIEHLQIVPALQLLIGAYSIRFVIRMAWR